MKRNRNRRVIVFFFHRWKYQCRLVRGRLRERHRLDEQCPQRCTGNKNRRVRVDHCHLVSPPFHLILFTGRRGPDVRSAAARLSSKRFSMEEKKREMHKRRKRPPPRSSFRFLNACPIPHTTATFFPSFLNSFKRFYIRGF